uniref:Uncharacterized protein n=1 Tax=Burkholderia sp. (strain CCGE1003) TaxID=640512 RepID=E1TIQ2_BURSG
MDGMHNMVNPRLMAARNAMPFRIAGIGNKFQQLSAQRIVLKKHSEMDS